MTAGPEDHDEENDARTDATGRDGDAGTAADDGEFAGPTADEQGLESVPESDAAPETVDDEEEWRFSIGELDDADDGDETGGNVAGSLMQDEPLESGDINPENAFFFLLGSLGTIVFIVLAVLGL